MSAPQPSCQAAEVWQHQFSKSSTTSSATDDNTTSSRPVGPSRTHTDPNKGRDAPQHQTMVGESVGSLGLQLALTFFPHLTDENGNETGSGMEHGNEAGDRAEDADCPLTPTPLQPWRHYSISHHPLRRSQERRVSKFHPLHQAVELSHHQQFSESTMDESSTSSSRHTHQATPLNCGVGSQERLIGIGMEPHIPNRQELSVETIQNRKECTPKITETDCLQCHEHLHTLYACSILCSM